MELYNKIPEPLFEKHASSTTTLSENTEDWAAEITNEAYKQLPFLSGKEISVDIQKVDEESKSGIGVVKVISVQKKGSKPIKKQVIFPVVVKQKEMYPLDVMFLNGNLVPATKREVDKYFFNPSLFIGAKKSPGKKKMDSSLFPFSPSSGLPLGSTQNVKVAHITQEDYKETKNKIESDNFLKKYLSLEGFEPQNEPEVEKLASDIPSSLDAIIVANDNSRKAYGLTRNPFGIYKYEDVNIEKLAEDQVFNENQEVLIGEGEGLKTPGELNPESGVISVPHIGKGIYFDRVVDIDGTPIDNKLFITDEYYGVQEKVAGEQVKLDIDRNDEIKNKGIFYFKDGDHYVATYPIAIKGKVEEGYTALKPEGEMVKIAFSENMKMPVKIEENLYCLPSDSKFIQLPKKFNKTPVYTPEQVNEKNRVTLSKTYQGYYFDGPPINDVNLEEVPEKVASLALLGLGADADQTQKLIKKAEVEGTVNFYTNQEFKSEDRTSQEEQDEFLEEITNKARRDLLNEAAVIKKYASDREEKLVDELLSLNFINKRNVVTFLDELPNLQTTGETLSGLLLASRLGLNSIPEEPIVSSIENLGEVIESLQVLKENYESAAQSRENKEQKNV